MADSIITSVTQQTAFARPHGDSGSDFLPAQIPLNVRGRHFVLDRETLNHLPESLLNTMFPNGVVHLGRGYDTYGYGAGDYYYGGAGEAEQTWVDFDPDMLEHVLQAYGRALGAQVQAPTTPGNASGGVAYHDRNPLVVLREELDYFVVPASGRTRGDVSDVPGFTLGMAKTRCGELLAEDDSVFEPLERTMQRNLDNIIEQQLIDMLCLAGFPRDARWGCRRVEPSRSSVTSLLTVPLDESADQSRMVAAQKLLLFYKKPARKCWWEGEDVNAGNSDHKIDLKLWCRRTWTLELVLV
ncbi:hypothetical protein COEREDRAFT_37074 [Coemansia reversa NRRL 1564]|uniref:Phosphatase activator n=1 Tax=Coemansia reversa (strain ATCC 12441 / NRRL 1564) TaxID=763665 RepID=A0A2G5BKD0_COERN|nr:hypothetical protein COEREDRAFT_37074 [Coemansia reversa NRRL 1564]|eukprot:PIA19459.1 hypothetical protein COEREDRAFT_37074 [Coemansia reversa NRRL 1564]